MLFLTVVLLTTSFHTLTAFAACSNDENSSCNVKAWVRAEDLSPNAIVNGDLRVKVNPACSDEIASVSLELRFDEFSKVKYLKEGATLPTLPDCGDASSPSYSSQHCGYIFGGFGDSDRDKYYESLHDPALWVVKAEERTAFKSAATLIEGSFDYSQPVIVPFTVAVPNVNYPPALSLDGYSFGSDVGRETDSKRAYRYTALIAFKSGHKVEIPAGYTTFDPVHDVSLSTSAFLSNVTFENQTEKTILGAQVTLESGNVVRTGDTVKGRIVIHRLTDGSTPAQDVSIQISSERDHRWAHAQAASGGHVGAFRLFDSSFSSAIYHSEVSISNYQYDDILRREGRHCSRWESFNSRNVLTEQKQYLDFELKVSENAVRNFHAYYATSVTSLVIDLYVPYPLAQGCVFGGEDKNPIEDTNQYEVLWDDRTPVGQSHQGPGYVPTQRLVAKIPITLIGAQRSDPSSSSGAPVHYLTPGAASPVILASPPSSCKDVVFPVSQPIITPEPTENTTSRLLSSLSGIVACMQDPPDPSRHYFSGPYVGILWKKKMMAEHMVKVVVPTAEEDALSYHGSSDFQVAL